MAQSFVDVTILDRVLQRVLLMIDVRVEELANFIELGFH
jgi:hypothetical protein